MFTRIFAAMLHTPLHLDEVQQRIREILSGERLRRKFYRRWPSFRGVLMGNRFRIERVHSSKEYFPELRARMLDDGSGTEIAVEASATLGAMGVLIGGLCVGLPVAVGISVVAIQAGDAPVSWSIGIVAFVAGAFLLYHAKIAVHRGRFARDVAAVAKELDATITVLPHEVRGSESQWFRRP